VHQKEQRTRERESRKQEASGQWSVKSNSADLDRKFWAAMAMFVVLAVLAWWTMGPDKVLIQGYSVDFRFFGHPVALRMPGHWVELRLLPMIVLGGFAVRTVLARQAERIRRENDS